MAMRYPFKKSWDTLSPAERAQNDLRRLAALLPGFTLPVTAVFNLLPGFFLLYAATPAAVIPAPCLVGRKFFLFRFVVFLRD